MAEVSTFEQQLEEHGRLVFTNKGVSMMPLLREDRDIMVIERKGAERCKKYDAVLFRRPGMEGRGAYVLHRILRVNPDGSYWIVGDNCVSGETVREEQILGVLTAVVRDGRTVSVTDRGYRLYVRLWCAPYRLRFFILRARNGGYRVRSLAARCRHKLRGK